MKKVFTCILALVLGLSMFACASTTPAASAPAATEAPAAATEAAATEAATAAPAGGYIGISMPTQSSERWIKDGNTMKEILEAKGYTVDLQYAEDDIPTQKSQIENMITKGANVLIIAAVDASTLSATLDQAGKDGVKIIAYDRLLVDTDAVSYYATFDNRGVGKLQAQSLVDGLKANKGEGPYNIELFAGSPLASCAACSETSEFFAGAPLQPLKSRHRAHKSTAPRSKNKCFLMVMTSCLQRLLPQERALTFLRIPKSCAAFPIAAPPQGNSVCGAARRYRKDGHVPITGHDRPNERTLRNYF